MAGKYCPSWIFNLCVARTAYDFITSDLPIKSYAKKYAAGLSEHYAEIKTEEVEQEAELVLRFLVETNSEESDQLLNNFGKRGATLPKIQNREGIVSLFHYICRQNE